MTEGPKVKKKATTPAKKSVASVPVMTIDAGEQDSELLQDSKIPMSAQTARAVINCIECRKPRVVYSRKKVIIILKMRI